MANELQGKRVAFLFTEGVEQVELTQPLDAVRGAGAEVDLISLEPGDVQMWEHFDKGDTIEADRAVSDLPAFCAKVVEEFAEGRHPGILTEAA